MLGEGILKGLAETARNFFGSYVDKERLTTVQYPEERLPQIENSRNFPFLVYDGDDWQAGLHCVSCFICEKECPPKCILIEKSTDKKPDHVGKPQFYPKQFSIDVSVCMSCQICVEVCPFNAIKMDVAFENATQERFNALVLTRDKLAKSNEYYHQIHPTEATAVDAELAADKAKAEAAAKATAAAAAAKAAAAKEAAEKAAASGASEPGAPSVATASSSQRVGEAPQNLKEAAVAKAVPGTSDAPPATPAPPAPPQVPAAGPNATPSEDKGAKPE